MIENKNTNEMTLEELKEYRRQKAKATREANKARREARRQQQQEDRELIINTLRSVLNDPRATVRQRLRAAQMLNEIK